MDSDAEGSEGVTRPPSQPQAAGGTKLKGGKEVTFWYSTGDTRSSNTRDDIDMELISLDRFFGQVWCFFFLFIPSQKDFFCVFVQFSSVPIAVFCAGAIVVFPGQSIFGESYAIFFGLSLDVCVCIHGLYFCGRFTFFDIRPLVAFMPLLGVWV